MIRVVYEGGEISIWYDPMIDKLCTHAETREEGGSAMGSRARWLLYRRHPAQRAVSVRNHAEPALAVGQSVDRLIAEEFRAASRAMN